MRRLANVDACSFEDLFDEDRSRGALVTTFLALLEMIRLKMIRVFQSASFGPIRVYRRDRPDDAPKPLGDAAYHGGADSDD
jgi:segregation and condensation protein A